jgi:outer membrane lipoprotein-sorting protein
MRWLIVVVMLIAGCAPVPDLSRERLPAAELLLAKAAENSGRYRTLDAEAGVGLTVKGKYYRSRQFLLLERPDRIRADVLTGFGQLVLQMASDGQNLAVFLNNTVPGHYYYGAASYRNLSRFIRIPLKAEDLLALLTYDPPLIDHVDERVDLVDGRYRLVLSDSDSEQHLLFDADLDLTDCIYSIGGRIVLKVGYDKISADDRFPREVVIEIPQEETRVVLKYSEIRLNGEIDQTRFRLTAPNNSIREPLP